MAPRGTGWTVRAVAIAVTLLMLSGSLPAVASGHGNSPTPTGNIVGKGVNNALLPKGLQSQGSVAQKQGGALKVLAKNSGPPPTGTSETNLPVVSPGETSSKASGAVSPSGDNRTMVGTGMEAAQSPAVPQSSPPCSYCLWVTPGTPVEIGTLVTWNVNIDTSSMASDGYLVWTGLPSGCGSPPSSGSYSTPGYTGGTWTVSYACTPNQVGTSSVYVTTKTTDWVGDYTVSVNSNTVSLTVSPVTLTTQTPTASPTVVDVGSATTFYVSIAWDNVGGFVTFAWNNLPAGCTSSNNPYVNDDGAELLCTPTGAGTSGVTVTSTVMVVLEDSPWLSVTFTLSV